MRFAIPSVSLALALAALPAAGQQVYRCESGGKVAYSDAPCIGAKVIDATPTQGMDKMAGRSRKGREVQRSEMNRQFDEALHPLHGRSHEEMNVLRKRVYLSGRDRQQCVRLDGLLPTLEADAARATGPAKARADVDLYKARKQFFDLKC
ncbi:DUF4124 domain-containing protein [Xenophilus azovorans]|uniref:DUF4124 domain-containing protein n=1 Tax=Xenophilus azovorans TaxID=151755 RepID=UPI00068BF5F3|nr:DUF4124 domain-containing protein [Xenophilus azovorans]